MTHSFRLRIALLSALLSGVVLTAFAATAWLLIRNERLAHVDREVRNQAERESQRLRSLSDWQRVESAIATEAGLQHRLHLFLLVQDRDGSTVYRSPSWPLNLDASQFPWPHSASPAQTPPRQPNANNPPTAPPPPVSRDAIIRQNGHQWRIGLAVTAQSRVAVGIDTAAVDAEMKGILTAFLIALPFCLVLIGIGGWTLSNRALAPLSKLTSATQRVTAEGLDQRISVQGEDREFLELIDVFNRMLERLERSFQQAYRFSADAAHELKTPLAILQGQIERAIQQAEDGSSAQAELSSILDEVRRLSSISRKLLLLSQADAGSLKLYSEPIDLSLLLAELLEDAAMLAPHLLVTGEIQDGITIQADRTLLPQVFHNLVSNAIKYNVENGWIRISATRQADQVNIFVANSSDGISAADREKVFLRFYRTTQARTKMLDGSGLGLSVSREIARAHGGDLYLEECEQTEVRFCFSLPA